MKSDSFVLGIDFGTDSVRAVVVAASNGAVAGTCVVPYRRWAEGRYCDPLANRFRQHPRDYLEAMETATAGALREAGTGVAARVRGLAADTTGSTPVLADRTGMPLALSPAFQDDPDAMFILWKDHTSVAQAERINAIAHSWNVDYTQYEGGVYSSEWFWAKVLRVLETNPAVAEAAVTAIEHCDWIPAVLTGAGSLDQIKRSRCAAGHKAMWHARFGGYPSDDFMAQLHPRLPALKASLGAATWTSDVPFGTVCDEWAHKLGIPRSAVVAVGAFDAHMGAVGGGIRPHQLLKVMGTSTCDILVAPPTEQLETLVPGICGQVDGSVLPGAIGYEAGQSAFGDVYAWFKQLLCWPLGFMPAPLGPADPAARERLVAAWTDRIIPELEAAATAIPPGDGALVALDWMNGRRTPDANQRLKGAITGIQLGTDAPRIYRALVEATAFGSRAIVERFRAAGIRIDSAIAIGGVATKSPFVMQTVADVMNMDIAVSAAEQAVALGAAMFAATAAGLHPTVSEAQQAMSAGIDRTHRPDPEMAARYDQRYGQYLSLGSFVERQLT
ncbi:MAG: ribulokinase [Pseudomonadota bacterium]